MAKIKDILFTFFKKFMRLISPKGNQTCPSRQKRNVAVVPDKPFPIGKQSSIASSEPETSNQASSSLDNVKDDDTSTSPDTSQEIGEEKTDEGQAKPRCIDVEAMVRMVEESALDEKEKAFINDRLNALTFDWESPKDNQNEIIKWLCNAIDFIDELRLFSSSRRNYEGLTVIQSIENEIRKQIANTGGEIIDFDSWTPELQRAISVTKDPSYTQTVILTKGNSGLSYRGDLIRKQEVSIAMPQTIGDD